MERRERGEEEERREEIVTLGIPGQVEWRRTVMGSWRFLFLADEQRDGRGACR
jgi:hypothetical protein